MVDTRDLKSLGQKWLYEFESRPRHFTKTKISNEKDFFSYHASCDEFSSGFRSGCTWQMET